MLKIPNSFTPLIAKVATEATSKIEARIDMSAEVAGAGLCPDCKSPMEPIFLEDDEVMSCLSCRIVLPLKDPEPEPEPEIQHEAPIVHED